MLQPSRGRPVHQLVSVCSSVCFWGMKSNDSDKSLQVQLITKSVSVVSQHTMDMLNVRDRWNMRGGEEPGWWQLGSETMVVMDGGCMVFFLSRFLKQFSYTLA